MKTIDELKPNYAPVYAAAMYPDLAAICHRHGYALAVHGSLAKDFDLIAVPWTDEISQPQAVLFDIKNKYVIDSISEAEEKNHGRIAYTINIGFGECRFDFSFFPTV